MIIEETVKCSIGQMVECCGNSTKNVPGRNHTSLRPAGEAHLQQSRHVLTSIAASTSRTDLYHWHKAMVPFSAQSSMSQTNDEAVLMSGEIFAAAR